MAAANGGMTTRVEGLVDQVRADIAANVHAPGERLTETALAEQYGVSRTPVREALRVLVQEMLLEYVPNWGYRVARLRMRDLDDLYAVRLGIESQAVRRLAEGHGDLDQVAALLVVWGATAERIVPGVKLIFADEAYHEQLAEASGGTVLPDLLRSVNRRLHPFRMREFVDADRVARTYDQHAAILQAVLDGDSQLASAAMEAHILEGRRYVRRNALTFDLIDTDPPSGTSTDGLAGGEQP